MPIKYKTIQKSEPGVKGGGNKKYYATPVYRGEKTLNNLSEEIEKISTVSGADIRAVLYALVDVMERSLANGEIVRIGDLGSMRISISSEGKTKIEEVNASAIKGAKVLFTPSTAIKKMLNNLTYEK